MVTLVLVGLVGGLAVGVVPVPGGATPRAGSPGAPRPLASVAGLVASLGLVVLLGTTLLAAVGLPDARLREVGVWVLAVVGLVLAVPALGRVLERPLRDRPSPDDPDAADLRRGRLLATRLAPRVGPVVVAVVVVGAPRAEGIGAVLLAASFGLGVAVPQLLLLVGARADERGGAVRRRAAGLRVASGVALVVLASTVASGAPVTQDDTPVVGQRATGPDPARGSLAPLSDAQNRGLSRCVPGARELGRCGPVPALKGTGDWFNTPGGEPVSLQELRGKVVLVDFLAYSCVSCRRDAPHVEAWYDAYRQHGLEVVGVHAPRFAFEKDAGNLRGAIREQGITWPVVQDDGFATWTSFRNRYRPAKYLVDAEGTVRAITFGEGDHAGTERKIRALLREADPSVDLPPPVEDGSPDDAPTDGRTRETYLGWSLSRNYAGEPELASDRVAAYQQAFGQADDTYSLGGRWRVEAQRAVACAGATARLSFSARSVFHVLGGEGTVVVSVDGGPPRTITVSGRPDLYEIYSAADAARHTITVRYSPGVEAYTFSFG